MFTNFYRRFIQGFSRIAVPLTLILKITGLSGLSALKAFKAENDEVIGGGGRADEMVVDSSKSKNCQKSRKPQRPENFAKAIGLEEPSFLTFDTRLAFTKMGSGHTKLMMEDYRPLLKPLRSGAVSTKFCTNLLL